MIDHNALIGAYPFRRIPASVSDLLDGMDRLGIESAWVGHVPSIWYRDCAAGNDELFEALEDHRERLHPVPAINPAFPGWEEDLEIARAESCPSVRTYPSHYGFSSAGPAMAALTEACADAELVLTLTMRIEDGRQRSRLDTAPDLLGADVRNTVRSNAGVQLLVTNADRAIVEEVHWGSTPQEADRIRYDISWIWGPPEDHLRHLHETVGAGHFVLGTFFPFRLPENALAKLDLI